MSRKKKPVPKFYCWPQPTKPDQPYGPTPKQRELFIEELPDNEKPHLHPVDVVLYIGGARCFSKGTPVLMFSGIPKFVENIEPGELVMGPDSQPRLVTSLARGREQMYRVVPDKGEPWVCNESHNLSLWFKRSKGKGLIRERIEKISVKDYLNKSAHYKRRTHLYKVAVEFPEQEVEIDPYFLGYWLGDGTSMSTGITTMEPEVKKFAYSYADSLNLDVREQHMENNRASTYYITSHNKFNKLHRMLKEIGLIGNKHIPQKYLINSRQKRLELLAGLLDSDGCLVKHSNLHYIWANSNQELATQVAFLAASLGFRVTNSKILTKDRKRKLGCYYDRIYINGNNLDEIPCRVERKKAPRRNSKYNYLATGFKVEPVGEDDFYGFSLAGEDSRFLLADFTVVENSGKTTAAVARVVSFLLKNKGAVGVVGATNYPLLQRSALKEWTDRFTEKAPWDFLKHEPPIIIKKPSQTDKRVIFANGSQCYFLHFSDPEVLRGIDADIIHFEEASLLPDEASFEELGRRLSGRKGKVRQLILTTNPTGKGNWIDEKFKLHQLRSNFTGEPEPIVPPCRCHLCQACLITNVQNGYDDQGHCTVCGATKETDCPGNQVFFRVIQTATTDNQHIPADLAETLKAFMDEKTHSVFVGGATEDLRQGEVYKAYSDDNVFKVDQPFDLDKDLIWTLDFNFEPQCSVIIQEQETTQGFQIKVLDEIIMWNALPEHAAQAFCNHPEVLAWKESNRTVFVYGDPAGLYGTGAGLAPSFYKIIYDVLIKHGFDVRIMMKRPDKDAIYKEPVKIPVAGRIDAVNCMLRTAEEPPRIRMMLNPRCKFLKRSLREVRWCEDGKNIDKSVDKRAARKPDKTNAVMTHPTDALGYYVYKRFPIIKTKKGVPFIQIPGETIMEIRGGSVIQSDRASISVRAQQKIDDRIKRREERRQAKEDEEYRQNNSIRGQLDRYGIWGSGFSLF